MAWTLTVKAKLPQLGAIRRLCTRTVVFTCNHGCAESPPRIRLAVSLPTWRSLTTLQPRPESAMDEYRYSSMVAILQEQVQQGNLRYDKAQERVAKRLARLQQALQGYDNEILFQPSYHEVPTTATREQKSRNPFNDGSESNSSTLCNHTTVATNLSPNIQNNNDDGPTSQSTPPRLRIPRGLYIHGSVGTGKSMLMDTFYAHAPVQKKVRYHFHSFLAMVHQQIHHLKQQDLKEKGRNFSVDTSLENNPIHRVGLHLSRSISLLCLDEFQVTDIADAVILSQLFQVLFVQGTVVVATSNRPPQDLYEGGLNRSYFLPFLDLLQKHCIVHAIQSQVDYRHVMANSGSTFSFLSTLSSSTSSSTSSPFFGNHDKMMPIMQEIIDTIFMVDEDDDKAMELAVGFQRRLWLKRTYESNINRLTDYTSKNRQDPDLTLQSVQGHVPVVVESSNQSHPNSNPIRLCRLEFVEMCDADLGALDYRAIAQNFDIVTLENVVAMDLEGHNRARRFITLIDELYEAKCCLLLTVACVNSSNNAKTTTGPKSAKVETPMDLFQVSHREQVPVVSSSTDLVEDNEVQDEVEDPETVLGIDVATQGGTAVGALASVRELAFAFERASSRIVEMCSPLWWEKQLAKKQQQ